MPDIQKAAGARQHVQQGAEARAVGFDLEAEPGPLETPNRLRHY
jgi:hypothetical protein